MYTGESLAHLWFVLVGVILLFLSFVVWYIVRYLIIGIKISMWKLGHRRRVVLVSQEFLDLCARRDASLDGSAAGAAPRVTVVRWILGTGLMARVLGPTSSFMASAFREHRLRDPRTGFRQWLDAGTRETGASTLWSLTESVTSGRSRWSEETRPVLRTWYPQDTGRDAAHSDASNPQEFPTAIDSSWTRRAPGRE